MGSRINKLEKQRKQRPVRRLRLGGYLIITDAAETEVHYFNGFKDRVPDDLKNELQIKVFSKKELRHIISFAEREIGKDERFREAWIIFDRDEVKNFDALIRAAEESGIKVGWSNPCFEIWLAAYFGEMKMGRTSRQCCEDFEKILVRKTSKKEYKKADENLYQTLMQNGDEALAIKIAKKRFEAKKCECYRPSEMDACTTVYQLIEEIKSKIQK